MLTEDQKIVREVVEAWHTDMAFPPGGWEDDAPKWLETRAISERIDLISQRAWDKCTDAEVSGYMYCASLANPLDADWTQIITYEAAKQLPQLRENLKSIPEKLSDYQERELLDLKYKIRNSQIKHYKEKRKESSMAKRKVVLDERENGVLVGVMQEQCDPVTQVYEMTLEAALLKVPELLVLADTKWKSSPRNPAYQPPPAPAKTTAAAQKPVAKTPAATVPGKKAEELPLLKGKKSPVPQTKSPPPVPSAINVAPGGTEGTASDGAVGKLTHGPERVDQSPRVICVEPSDPQGFDGH